MTIRDSYKKGLNGVFCRVDWDWNLQGACEAHQMELIQKYIEIPNFSCWNRGLIGACWGGHRDLVDLMIEKGADYWNGGLRSACQGGHRDLVELMIEKGADDWNWGLYTACRGGHRDIAELMIKKGARNWNTSLLAASMCGHRELAEFFSLLGGNIPYNELMKISQKDFHYITNIHKVRILQRRYRKKLKERSLKWRMVYHMKEKGIKLPNRPLPAEIIECF